MTMNWGLVGEKRSYGGLDETGGSSENDETEDERCDSVSFGDDLRDGGDDEENVADDWRDRDECRMKRRRSERTKNQRRVSTTNERKTRIENENEPPMAVPMQIVLNRPH